MSWDVTLRHELRGDLVCETPLYVGGWDTSAVADLAVARDGLDRPVIPGTSIAGAVRAWLAGTGRQDDLDDLFGWARKQDGKPSRIRVDDAPVIGGQVALQVRTGVGIDRNTRSAAAGFLYEREVLPAGTRFAFRLVADEPSGDGPDVAGAFTAVTAALRAGHVRLGAARTRGLGRVRLEHAETRTTNLADRSGLRSWLTGTAAWQALTDPATAEQPGRLTITVDWRPVSPVLVKDSLQGALVDILPLTATTADGKVRLLLPGSSVKGVLRAHAERIVRTVRGTPAPRHLRETLDAEALPGVVGLFGRSPQRRTGNEPSPGSTGSTGAGWRGALEIADCHSRGHISAEDWHAVVTARTGRPDAAHGKGQPHARAVEAASGTTRTGSRTPQAADRPPQAGDRPARPARDSRRAERQDAATGRRVARQALRSHLDRIAQADGLPLRIADHVAVDRWTGGAADSALFSVLEPVGAAWEQLRLTLDCRRAGGGDRTGEQLAVALLLLVLRDLADGWLTFGFGTTRGHGHIAVSGIRFAGTDLPGPWAALADVGTLEGVLADPPPQVRDAMARWASSPASHTADPGTAAPGTSDPTDDDLEEVTS